ncbi:MAG: ATP-binding protein [Actinomycetota bacterium]
MEHDGTIGTGTRHWTSRLVLLACGLWTLVLSISFALTVYHHREEVANLAANEARANLDKDLAMRLWGTSHGGVYVPVDDNTPPNPYLAHVPERDLTTPSGRRLTLMNPAYMLRQTMSYFGELYGIRGRITSLKLLNPINAPDAWEEAALHRFEAGERRISEVVDVDGQPALRVMRAMIMEPGCMKCHGDTGVKVGEVRGGIGVVVPLVPYYRVMRHEIFADGVIHVLLWLGGLAAIVLGSSRLRRTAIQRDHALAVLSESEDRYRRMVETAQEGVWVVDCSAVTVYANAVMGRLVGRTSEAMVGHPASDFLAPEDAPAALAHLSGCAGGTCERFEARLHHPDLGPVEVMIATSLLVTRQGTRVLCMVTDVSGLRRGEERLMQMVDQLTRSNVELERFAHVASHDLQEPLRNIVSFAQMVEQRYRDRLDDEGRQYIDFMVAGARRMHEQINDLLDYSRLDTPGGAFARVDTGAVVAAALAGLQRSPADDGAAVAVGSLPAVLGDRDQLTELFRHLLSNALKFHRPGVAPVVQVEGRRVGNEVEITVADNGIGIEPQYHGEIFGLFRRLHPAAAYGGTGMGLPICKRIVDRHRGRIFLDSVPGQGSTFHLMLPAAD